MVFSSILFLFLYLPLTLLVYYVTPLRWRNLALLVLNLIFYAWGEPVYIVIMFASIAIDYTHGMLVEKWRSNDKKARMAVASSVIFNLALLLFFKYYDFIMVNIAAVFPGWPLQPLGLSLPIGISFYTFQTMSYTIDVYRGDARAQHNIVNFGTFVTLFPQLIAGPIIKYKDLADQIDCRRENIDRFAAGVRTFVCGLCKKVLLANNIGMLWDTVAAAPERSVALAWLGAAAFALQIYFDFSGYSDMAIGLGRMLGFEFLPNFNYPFISKSATEFWRRWHISLGSWFREYVYIPLGGNRRGKLRTYFNILVVWSLTGIWHGASWNFLLWGLFFAALLMIEKAFLLKPLQRMPLVGHIYTVIFSILSFAIFAVDDMGALGVYLSDMFSGPLTDGMFWYQLRLYGVTLIVLILAATPLPKQIFAKVTAQPRLQWLVPVLCTLGLLLSTAYLVDSTYNPFLYFRF